MKCGAFFVEIELLNRPNTSSAQVTELTELTNFGQMQTDFMFLLFVQKLRNFLNSKEYDSISTEYKTCGFLTKKNRKKLVNGLYVYVLKEVSPNPSEAELIGVCNDMLTIFPKLKLLNSAIGGMVRIFSPYICTKWTVW